MSNRGFFLQQKDKDIIWHPFDRPGGENIVIKKARGAYLHDAQNRKYLDAVSSWWVNVHGHGNQALKNALNRQFSKADHIIFSGFTHEPAIRLADALLKKTQHRFGRVFLSDNGSTAIEVALKMALQYLVQNGHRKIKILALEDAYHGDTFGAMSVGGRSIFTQAFDQLLFDVQHLPVPTEENLSAVTAAVAEAGKNNDALLFIYEPLVQGSGGMNIYEPAHLAALLRAVKQFNAVCIADEVMTGFYRTGTFTATDQVGDAGLYPDMMCLSKGITGGTLPLGATLVHEKFAQWFAQREKTEWFYHGHSYTGNPLSCAVAVESMRLFNKKRLEQIAAIEQWHRAFAQEIQQHPRVKNLRVCGTILRFEYVSGDEKGYAHSVRDRLYRFYLDRGLLVRPLGNVVYFMPPYIVSAKDLQLLYRTTRQLLEAAL